MTRDSRIGIDPDGRIAGMGSGGVGGYVGSRLAASDPDVTFRRAARISRRSATTI